MQILPLECVLYTEPFHSGWRTRKLNNDNSRAAKNDYFSSRLVVDYCVDLSTSRHKFCVEVCMTLDRPDWVEQ